MDIVIADDTDQCASQSRELFWEYLQWANANVNREFGVNFDIASIVETDMNELSKFMPSHGCLLLGYVAGIACLKQLSPHISEVKRIYVRPETRHHGLGRALLDRLIQEATKIGYTRIRLDSARFMTDAHRLYRAVGFAEIDAYEGSEIPADFQKNWIFMEKVLWP